MRKRQLLRTLTTGGLFAALLVLGMSMVPSSGRADNDNNGSQDEKQMIQIGLSVASSRGIQLNLAGKDQDMVGLGSYLVNVAADCNGCHSQGPATEWCCAVAGIPPNSGTGNPYLLSPPFSGTKQVNPKTYLGGGRDFGALPGQTVHIFSRNLTPDLNGVPEGGRSLSDFKQILRTGVDLDQLHPNCPTNAPNCLTHPFNRAVLQIMPWPYGHLHLENPSRRRRIMSGRIKSREELEAELEELQAENEELQETVDELEGQLDDISEIIAPEEEEEEPGEGAGDEPGD